VELLALVLLELAGAGATAAEDPEVVLGRGPISWILVRPVSTGLRSTGADDEEIAAINMAYTSGEENYQKDYRPNRNAQHRRSAESRQAAAGALPELGNGSFWLSARFQAFSQVRTVKMLARFSLCGIADYFAVSAHNHSVSCGLQTRGMERGIPWQ
jgi:hypothetical protein